MYPVLAIAEDILEGHIAKIDCGGICETLYLGMGKGRHAAIVSLVVARADPRYGEVRIAGWRCAAVKQGIGPADSTIGFPPQEMKRGELPVGTCAGSVIDWKGNGHDVG